MYKKKTYDQKHLTTSQRIHIEKGLNDGLSFAAIARKLDKHPSTIAKEVKKYRTFQKREVDPRHPLRCGRFKDCSLRFLCDKPNCVNTAIAIRNVFLHALPFVRNIWNHNVKLSVKPLMFAIIVQDSVPVIRAKLSILHRMQINPPRICLFHADRELIRLLSISHSLMILYLRYYCRGSRWHTFMPFTDMKFPVPEKRCITILIKVFLLQGISICAARSVTNVNPGKPSQGLVFLQKSSASAVLMRISRNLFKRILIFRLLNSIPWKVAGITVRRLS